MWNRLPSQPFLRFLSVVCVFAASLFATGPFATSLAFAEEPELARPTPEQLVFFENEVRPLLAKHCYECHSANSKKLQAGLRLDSPRAIHAGGDSGSAVEPGDPDASLLISAVRYEDFEMPPTGKLAADEIAALEKWVAMGAPWPEEPEPQAGDAPKEFDWRQRKDAHWCWQPITSPQPPEVSSREWPTNAIDNFILAKLNAAEMTPAAPADRRTLLRRVYYDLVGLPPTKTQLDAFLADPSEDAYEQVVDELLQSPQYGEKWTRHWLDLVRYGETLGHEFDYPLHQAWRYRDYVIRAINADVPYDQFVHEHVAGDLLDRPRMHPTEAFNESIIGTGFWYLGEACHAPTDVRQDEADRVDNQIDVFSKTFLGLTVACARCHDHKFDPIPTRDYYALYGYIQSSRRQRAMLDPHGKIRAASKTLREINARRRGGWRSTLARTTMDAATLKAAILKFVGSEDKSIVEALKQPTHPLFAVSQLKDAEDFGSAAAKLQAEVVKKKVAAETATAATEPFMDFSKDDAGDWYFTGEAFSQQATKVGDVRHADSQTPLARAGAIDSGLYGTKLEGALRSPTFVLPAKRLHYLLNANKARIRLIVDGYTMDEFNALLFNDAQKKNVNTQGQTKWITQGNDLYHYVGHRAHIEILDEGDGFASLEEIRYSDEGAPALPPHPMNAAVLERSPDNLEKLLDAYVDAMQASVMAVASKTASNADIDVVNWLVEHNVVAKPKSEVELASKASEVNRETPTPMHVIALEDGDAEEEYVFIRGNHRNQGEEAPRRLLVAIGGEDQQPDPKHSGRLDLATKLTAADNPLTSRVAVNRIWHHLFGRGIVPSVDDFGQMGQPPSHPELLDWLANDFVHDKQWSIKRTIKQIVMSSTYRMSAVPTVASEKSDVVDPENVLLYRAPVRRLTGEAIRDTLLQLSGRLDATMFGPSVKLHLTPFMEGRGRPGSSGPRDGAGRRSLYIEVRRNFLWPMMMTFDRPSPFSTMGRRSNSNVPAQSLMLMNDPFVVEQAVKWAERITAAESETDARIQLAFEMAFSRPPSRAQLQQCRDFVEESGSRDAWSDLCHMLINLKPFIYVN